MKYLISLIFLLSGAFVTSGLAQTSEEVSRLPPVFQLGEFEVQMDKQSLQHQTQLLTACDYDIEMAYGKWISMVKEMEAYSKSIDFDINGVKVWLNIFFESNGQVANIGYYLKPNSKNIDRKEFAAFLKSFINNYAFPHAFKEPFSHYGSAGFPTSAYEVPARGQDTSSAGRGND